MRPVVVAPEAGRQMQPLHLPEMVGEAGMSFSDAAGGAGWKGFSSFLGLGSLSHEVPTDLLADCSRRLRWSCLIVGGLFGLLLLNSALLVLFGSAGPAWKPPRAWVEVAWLRLGLVVASATVYGLTRRAGGSWRSLRHLGFAYEAVVVLGVAWADGLRDYHAVVQSSIVAILFFPVMIPARPATTFGVALGCGLGSTITEAWSWQGPPVMAIIEAHVVMDLVVACMAAVQSAAMCRLRDQVSVAREIGRYRLETRLGSGGMGEVWKARHHLLARPAAIKLIRPDRLGDSPDEVQATLERFGREARACAMLRSPHTITVYDFGEAEDGTFYYVMELLDGLDMNELVTALGPVPPARAVHLLRQVCASLDEAHAAGLVHRDIKPANIYVCRAGGECDFVKVLDFGLVKDVQSHAHQRQLTPAHVVMGTPDYMAPEALVGDGAGPAADIYAVGCVGYWLLTGRTVFMASGAHQVATAHVYEAPSPPSRHAPREMPRELEVLILECLHKAPQDRPASAREVMRRLEAVPLEAPWTEAAADACWKDIQEWRGLRVE